MQINLWMHILGSAAVIANVLVPVTHDWVTRRDLFARLASASTRPIATIGASIS